MATPTRQSPSPAADQALAPLTRLSGLKRLRRRRTVALIAGGLLLLGGGAWSLGPGRNGNRDLSDYTVSAERGTLPGVVTASGELEAVRRVNVSPKRQGVLNALLVEEGDVVRKGQVLARMDPGDLRDRLDELKALERQAQADYDARQADFRRRDILFQRGAISAADLDDFRARYLTSQAALAAAQERIEQRSVESDDLLIRAPFDGVITQRFAEPGAFVTPTTTASATAGATSSSIVELSQGLEVAAKVPESDIGRIRVGQSASVRVDAYPDQRFEARVREIAPRAVKTDNVTSFEVELDLIGPAPDLRIGMTVDVDFQTGRTNASTLVPTVAIVTEEGKPGVLLVGKQDQPRFQAVELGASSGSQTAILNGVKPGTKVFIDLPPWAKNRD
ncbi:efflux RND transporter periplasmic adaptor subunit [Synechococcus sp. RS9916]|uniref:efflux RND transporter periplasmic adaptor subunit n=1 Tax=Synechococcus sp. RS9916 TaxID=221359 RepID=UPI0000E53696|nr:efflux RND transporter periplasmic adaptor subunit [Synechococcus sp. RS9916]EAU74184.1 possible membrane fusion protein [Synechococcus sp. RS9916]